MNIEQQITEIQLETTKVDEKHELVENQIGDQCDLKVDKNLVNEQNVGEIEGFS